MSLSKDDLQILLSHAKKAALSAGQMIREKSHDHIETSLKESGDQLASQIVTEVDIASEKIILDELRVTFESYQLGLLAEENTENRCRFKYDYFWCIDPLDGTLCFSQNKWGHSVSIALVSREGKVLIGVVYDNCTDNLYWSIKGQGAYKNEERLLIKSKNDQVTLFVDHSFNSNDFNHSDDIKIHIPGGAVMNAISTIENAPAIYFKRPKEQEGGGSLWDFAATSLIQAEAGGVNSDFYGRPLNLNKKETTFMNHDGIIYTSSKELLSDLKLGIKDANSSKLSS